MDKIDVAIIGGGVIGCATAERLAKSHSVIVLESLERYGEGVTSRNSGVIHSGLYYPPNSIKASSCIRGNILLYEWCEKYNVPYRKTGKFVVAMNSAEEEDLCKLFENAKSSGAKNTRIIQPKEIRSLEPSMTKACAALLCPETGIVDPAALTESLIAQAQNSGAVFSNRTKVISIQVLADGYKIETTRGPIYAGAVVNAAGLYADEIARMAGIEKYKIYPNRGHYFKLKSKIKYNHLIYPIRKKQAAGLGVHLTIDLGGNYRLGPDTEYIKNKDDFSSAEEKIELFFKSAKNLLGEVSIGDLSYDTCGIRPKLRSPEEKEEKDFVISQDLKGFVNLVGIESPGLTSSLAIADEVLKMF